MRVHRNQIPNLSSWILLGFLGASLAGCNSLPKITHVPPGTSAQIALAKRAIPVEPVQSLPASSGSSGTVSAVQGIPAQEPDLPLQGASAERVIDLFNAGNASLDQGKHEAAIAAFQKVIKLNPGFDEAWIKLALCFENSGQEQKAVETLKQYKTVSGH